MMIAFRLEQYAQLMMNFTSRDINHYDLQIFDKKKIVSLFKQQEILFL